MGRMFRAICESCGENFFVRKGPGLRFFLLHCDQCGREKSVGTDKIVAANLQWSDDEGINELTGKCSCGGSYDTKATARCPRCRSDDYTVSPYGPYMLYD